MSRDRTDSTGSGSGGRGQNEPGPVEGEPDGAGRRRSGLTGRAVIALLVLAALVVSYASSLRAWSDQRSHIQQMQDEVVDRTERVGELEQTLERWDDPAYVAAQARERFGWVLPGETGFVVVREDDDPDATRDTSPGGGGPGGTGDSGGSAPWWQTLWGSVETAGHPPEPEPDRPTPARTINPEADAEDDTVNDAGDPADGTDGANDEG